MGKCRECGKDVSDEAKSCPNCGVASPVKKTSAIAMGCLAVIAFMVIITAINSGNSNSPSPRPPEPPHPSSGKGHFGAATKPIIWRSQAAMDKGIEMIGHKVAETHPELLLPYVACFAYGGESITILDSAFGRREVILDSGKTRGCRGWVIMESVVP